MSDFKGWPKPEGYLEGTVMSVEMLRGWALSMPEELQLQLFAVFRQVTTEASACFEMDHEATIIDAQRRAGVLAEENRRLRKNQTRLIEQRLEE